MSQQPMQEEPKPLSLSPRAQRKLEDRQRRLNRDHARRDRTLGTAPAAPNNKR